MEATPFVLGLSVAVSVVSLAWFAYIRIFSVRTVFVPQAAQRGHVNRQAAEQRAETLLREMLSPAAYTHLVRKGYIEVPSNLYPQRTYRIPRHRGSVEVYEMGRLALSLCVQPVESDIPDADLVVMHKLMIEGNEREYLKKANKFDRQSDLVL